MPADPLWSCRRRSTKLCSRGIGPKTNRTARRGGWRCEKLLDRPAGLQNRIVRGNELVAEILTLPRGRVGHRQYGDEVWRCPGRDVRVITKLAEVERPERTWRPRRIMRQHHEQSSATRRFPLAQIYGLGEYTIVESDAACEMGHGVDSCSASVMYFTNFAAALQRKS